MKHTLTTIILILSTIFASKADTTYLSLVNDAEKAVSDNDYPRAIELFQEALRCQPDNSGNVMLMSNIGMLSHYIGADSTAISYLTMAHEIAPKSITILTNRAKVFSEAGYYRHALRDLDMIVSLDSTLYRPLVARGTIYLATGQKEKAAADINKATTMTNPDKDEELSAALAWLAILDENHGKAVGHYSALIDLNPTAALYAARALSYVALEDYLQASDDISSGMKIDPECSELFVARACMNAAMYRKEDAEADRRRALSAGAEAGRLNALIAKFSNH